MVDYSLFSGKRCSRLHNADLKFAQIDRCGYITGCASTLLAGWRKQSECEQGGNLRFHNSHGTSATRALDRRSFCQRYQGFNGLKAEQVLKQCQHSFAVGMQNAKVTGAPKTLGQHML